MPGFTHLKNAQPISFAHYLLAYVEIFKRDKKGNYLKLLPYTWKLLNLRMKNNKNFNNLFNYLDKIISVQIRDKKFNES